MLLFMSVSMTSYSAIHGFSCTRDYAYEHRKNLFIMLLSADMVDFYDNIVSLFGADAGSCIAVQLLSSERVSTS
jgi:hypothetical protein